MKIKQVVLVVIFFLVSYGCSFMDVEHTYEPNAPFSSYKNFHWIQTTANEAETDVDKTWDERIRGKIAQELINKGFVESVSDKSDFLINYQFITQDRVAVARKDTYLNYDYRYASALDVDTYTYRTGSIVLDVIDPQSKEVVWQGHVYGFVDVHTDPKKQDQRLDKAIGMLLSKFPPN